VDSGFLMEVLSNTTPCPNRKTGSFKLEKHGRGHFAAERREECTGTYSLSEFYNYRRARLHRGRKNVRGSIRVRRKSKNDQYRETGKGQTISQDFFIGDVGRGRNDQGVLRKKYTPGGGRDNWTALPAGKEGFASTTLRNEENPAGETGPSKRRRQMLVRSIRRRDSLPSTRLGS